MERDRIHDCLDGEIPPESLTEAERTRLAALEDTVDSAVSVLRTAPVPDLTSRVLGSLPDPRPGSTGVRPGSRLAGWLWRPVSIRLRPVYVLAGIAAAALAGAVLVPRLGVGPPGIPAVAEMAATPQAPQLYVQFRLDAPGASRVAVAGSFTGWQPEYQLTEVAPGVWTVMVPLAPGVYDYTFVIDGDRMVVDPYAPRVADSFGGSNSRLFLPAPGGSV